MRLDVFLKVSCLIPRRSLAQQLCNTGLIKLNGMQTKPSKEVKPGDQVEITRNNRQILISILKIPEKQVSKKQAHEFYNVISEKKLENISS